MPAPQTCPQCAVPLAIPQPPPAAVTCPKCRVTFRLAAVPINAVAGGPPPAALPAAITVPVEQPGSRATPSVPPRPLGVILFLAGIGVLVVVGLVTAAIFFTQGTTKAEPKPVVETVEPPPPPPPPPPPDPRIKIVQPAVDKGVAYLKTKVPQLTGMRCGFVGLNGLALLECGVPPDDPAILRIAETIRAAAPRMNLVYDLAASLFFLNRWDEMRRLDDKDRKIARSLALRIVAGQLKNGIWGYYGVMMTPDQETKLVTALKQDNYKPTFVTTPSMSNTQFAMLAVWGSRKHGVPVRAPLLALAAYFHANQQADGCWHYPGHSLKATSTCAGLMSLAIERVLLEDREFASTAVQPEAPKKRADVHKAFAFVAKTIGRKKGEPGGGSTWGYGGTYFDADAWGDLYFLWTLERVGVIYSKELIGDKNWYDWGYPLVMKGQLPDGSWNEKHPPLIDTPFALLFLKRANIAKDLTDKLRELARLRQVQAAPVPAPRPRGRDT